MGIHRRCTDRRRSFTLRRRVQPARLRPGVPRRSRLAIASSPARAIGARSTGTARTSGAGRRKRARDARRPRPPSRWGVTRLLPRPSARIRRMKSTGSSHAWWRRRALPRSAEREVARFASSRPIPAAPRPPSAGKASARSAREDATLAAALSTAPPPGQPRPATAARVALERLHGWAGNTHTGIETDATLRHERTTRNELHASLVCDVLPSRVGGM